MTIQELCNQVFRQGQQKIEDAIGKDIVCDDGQIHTVKTIGPSYGFKDRSVVNEDDYLGTLTVNNLSLMHQLRGEPPPSQELLEEYRQICDSFEIEYKGKGLKKLGSKKCPKVAKKRKKPAWLALIKNQSKKQSDSNESTE